MTVSGPPTSINRLWLALAALACAGCLPTLAPAPFPAAIDTTQPGTLIGPFTGKVTDAQSGRPVPGAVVWVAWRFCNWTHVCLPAGTHTATTETDADGRYVIPALSSFPGAVRLDGVTLFIYKRGWVGYRSDRLYDEHAPGGALPRRDFAQTRNDAKLDRFPEGASHAAHVLFLGGSGALRAATRAEALQAGLDGGATPRAQAPLDATALVTLEELRQITGAIDDITVGRLDDRPRSPRYDSAHFRAAGRGEESDAAIRVFLGDTAAESERTYEGLLNELPNGTPLDPVPPGLGARAGRGKDGEGDEALLGLVVLDRAQRATVLVTCGASRCRDKDVVDTIARKVLSRLPGVAHPPPAPVKPETKVDDDMKLREPELKR